MNIAAETFPHAAGNGLEGFPDPIAAAIAAGAGVGSLVVETGTISLSNVEAGKNLTLSTSINTARSLLSLRGADVQASELLPESYSVSVHYSAGGAAVTASRFNVGIAMDVFFTSMQFAAGAVNTYPVSVVIASGSASNTATITAVDTTRTIIIPNGVKVHGSTTDGQVWWPWWVLTNSTTVTFARNTSGTVLTGKATVLEFN